VKTRATITHKERPCNASGGGERRTGCGSSVGSTSEDRSSTTIKEEGVEEALYADCSEEDVALAKRMRVAELSAPLETPPFLTEENLRTDR
jgi:hypothetical protein